MFLRKKRTLCVSLFLCAFWGTQSAIASNLMQTDMNNITQETISGNIMNNTTKSAMTLVSTDFSFDTLEETQGRLLIRGRKGLRSRRVR